MIHLSPVLGKGRERGLIPAWLFTLLISACSVLLDHHCDLGTSSLVCSLCLCLLLACIPLSGAGKWARPCWWVSFGLQQMARVVSYCWGRCGAICVVRLGLTQGESFSWTSAFTLYWGQSSLDKNLKITLSCLLALHLTRMGGIARTDQVSDSSALSPASKNSPLQMVSVRTFFRIRSLPSIWQVWVILLNLN